MAWSDVIPAIAISTAGLIISGVVVLFAGLLRKSETWMMGVKIIGIAVLLPLVVGGLAMFVHGTVIDPVGSVLAAVQIGVGLYFMARVARLDPESDR